VSSPFDHLGFESEEAKTRHESEQFARGDHIDSLIHRIFAQNESGKEWLEMWKEWLIMSPSAPEGADMLTIGKLEGMKSFVRSIIMTIEKVEGQSNE